MSTITCNISEKVHFMQPCKHVIQGYYDAVKISVLFVISAFERSPVQESRALAEKPRDAAVNFAASRGFPCDSTAFVIIAISTTFTIDTTYSVLKTKLARDSIAGREYYIDISSALDTTLH